MTLPMMVGGRGVGVSRTIRLLSQQPSQSEDVVYGSKHDLIGPPRQVSNLRPVKFAVYPDDSDLAVRLRELRQDTQKFNQEWWTKHNTEFKEGRAAFIQQILKTKYPDQPDKTTVSAEEMSEFYRQFMNSRLRAHVEYNKEWQRRNWIIILLAARVKLEKIFRRT